MAKTPQIGNTIRVNDRMQKRYSYVIEARPGRDFASGFTPFYTPKEMLALGVFEGKYCNDCRRDLPESWFKGAKLAMVADPSLNCFGVKSLAALKVIVDSRHDTSPPGLNGLWACCRKLTSRS